MEVANDIAPEPTSSVPAPTANELAASRTDMASRRTVMAADRTLMAWVRTGMSMISFGFAIYKILEAFQASPESILTHPLVQQFSPRNAGLFLTGVGTLSILMGTIEYRSTLKEMHQRQALRRLRPAMLMALIMSAAGLLMFLSIVSKLF